MSKTKTSGMNKNQAKAVVAVLLSAVLLVGGGAVGYGMATDWTYQKATQIEQPDEEQPDEAISVGGAVISGGEGNGIQLYAARITPEFYSDYGVTAQADTAYTITATITPDDATWKDLTWTCEFANASSSWAQGKDVSDYVTINDTTSNINTVTCLNPFGEPVIVKATSKADPSITATCQVDYVKKVKSFEITSYNGKDAVTLKEVEDMELYLDITYSDGTLTPEVKVNVQAKAAAGLVNGLDDIERLSPECHDLPLYVVSDNTLLYETSETIPAGDQSNYFITDSSFSSMSWKNIIKSDCGCSYTQWGASIINEVKNIVYFAFRTPQQIATWQVTYVSKYNGVEYNSGTSNTITQLYDGSDQAVPVNGIEFDLPNIIF